MTGRHGAPDTAYKILRLAPGVTQTNINGYYVIAFTSIMFFTFIPGIQAALLTEGLGIEEDEQGGISGLIGVLSEIVFIAVIGFYGAMSDRIGRRPIAVVGYTLLAAGLLVTPLATEVWQLVALRCFLALGIAAITGMISTIIADYVRDETRGRANGLLGFCNGIGAVISVFLLLKLPDLLTTTGISDLAAIKWTYVIVAGLALLTALALRAMLKPGRPAEVHEERVPLKRMLREGFRTARGNAGLKLSYASAFAARADLAVVGTFLPLWVTTYATDQAGLSTTEALAKAGVVFGIANTMALIGAPLIGIFADRMRRVDALLIALAICTIGYGSTVFISDPLGSGLLIVSAMIGFGQVGGVITSQVLINEQAPAATRGSVTGAYGLCGGVGILVAFALGGWLFDAWRPAAPFLIFSAASGAVFVYGLFVRNQIHPVREVETLDAIDGTELDPV